METRKAGEPLKYLVVQFSDVSHLCMRRTLQTLGLFCRHFWGAMLKLEDYRFNIGLVNEHWLAERARKP